MVISPPSMWSVHCGLWPWANFMLSFALVDKVMPLVISFLNSWVLNFLNKNNILNLFADFEAMKMCLDIK